MWRYLTILAVLFVITQVTIPIQGQTADSRRADAQKQNNGSDSSKKPAAEALPASIQLTDSQRLQNEHKDHVDTDIRIISIPAKDTYDRAAFWANLILVAAGISGIFVALCTLRKLERQTRTAERQVDHIVTSERAWLIISSDRAGSSVIKPGPPPPYRWYIKNLGSTPARLIAAQAICKAHSGQKLPEEPVFPKGNIELGERILGPNDSLEFYSFWENEDGTIFKDRLETIDTVWLRAYGHVTYKTIFDSEIHESRYCDDFICCPPKPLGVQLADVVIDFRPDFTSPPAYTKHT